jgi:hypothetical protein
MVTLARIWAEIHQLNKATVEGRIGPRELETSTDSVAHALQAWANGLPPHLEENQDNLERYACLGLGNAYAALHFGYHFYHEVLYYKFLGDTGQQKSELSRLCDIGRSVESIPLPFAIFFIVSRA